MADDAKHLETLIVDMKESLEREMREGFGQMTARFDVIEKRVDRLDTRLLAIEIQLTGLNRSQSQEDQILSKITATQMAQQRAIDDLTARLSKLERGGTAQ